MRRLITTSIAAGILALLPTTAALAHGDHTQGDLVIATGFVVEPAYVGQPNGVQLTIEHDGEPVTDLAPDALSVDVTFGDQTTTLTPEPAFEVGEWGTPGDYHADFIPSAAGAYTFHVTGTIDGEKVDYEMTSGPKAFGEVEDPASATTSFFICTGSCSALDGKYTAFAKVVRGQDVVHAIAAVPVDGETPKETITMTRVRIEKKAP